VSFSDFIDMCPHTVTVEPFVSLDPYLKYTYGPPVTYRARVQGKNQMITTVQGEDVVSSVQVYLSGTVTPQDRITLPSPFSPSQPSILAIGQVSDESGSHHQVVYA
jgi:hypothetical protein